MSREPAASLEKKFSNCVRERRKEEEEKDNEESNKKKKRFK
jgi:hypothetical protein